MTICSVVFWITCVCVYISVIDFWFAVTIRFLYCKSTYIQIILSYFNLLISNALPISLHLYSPRIMLFGFDILFVCLWFPNFIVCFASFTNELSINIFFFLAVPFSFLPRDITLAFVVSFGLNQLNSVSCAEFCYLLPINFYLSVETE